MANVNTSMDRIFAAFDEDILEHPMDDTKAAKYLDVPGRFVATVTEVKVDTSKNPASTVKLYSVTKFKVTEVLEGENYVVGETRSWWRDLGKTFHVRDIASMIAAAKGVSASEMKGDDFKREIKAANAKEEDSILGSKVEI